MSFVLPIALGDTGRAGNELDRLSLLLDSFAGSIRPQDIGVFLVITRNQDLARVAEQIASSPVSAVVRLVEETAICPELAGDPETFHDFPTRNKGWYRQQLLKLGAARHVPTRFYMTLDADVVFTTAFQPADVMRGDRSIVNIQTADDFRALYSASMAEESIRIRIGRDRRAEMLLGMKRTGTWFYGETPVIMNGAVVRDLLAHIEMTGQEAWCQWLIRNTPWTEYSLYFTFAEARGLFAQAHVHGGPDSILRLSDSLWYAPEQYRIPRSLANWTWQPTSQTDGVAVVVQSYLGYDAGAVRTKVMELRTGR